MRAKGEDDKGNGQITSRQHVMPGGCIEPQDECVTSSESELRKEMGSEAPVAAAADTSCQPVSSSFTLAHGLRLPVVDVAVVFVAHVAACTFTLYQLSLKREE